MKMSILYAQKIKKVKDDEGVGLKGANLNYPVFLADVSPPESQKVEINKWLKSDSSFVLEQWGHWKKKI